LDEGHVRQKKGYLLSLQYISMENDEIASVALFHLAGQGMMELD
jgi:hypothetical protein